MRREISWNLLANLYGQIVTVAIQLVGVPIFLSVWSVEQYGIWVLISIVPAYMALSDLGVIGAVANRVAILRASGDIVAARISFHAGGSILLGLSVFFAALSILAWSVLEMREVWTQDARNAFLILCFSGIIGLYSYLLEIVYRAENSNATGVFSTNTARLLEWGCALLAVSAGGKYTEVALLMLLARTIVVAASALHCYRNYPQYFSRIGAGLFTEIRELISPSLAFLAFPAGNALSIQGITLYVGTFHGAAAAAAFAIIRTYSRVLLQITTVLWHSIWPELSKLFACGKTADLRKLFKKSSIATAIITLSGSAIMIYMGPPFLTRWTHGEVQTNFFQVTAFVASALLASTWIPPRVLLMALNRHQNVSLDYLFLSAIACAALSILGGTVPLIMAPAVLCLIELIMLLRTWPRVKPIMADAK